ncbi:lysM domain-containing GPI-anchored protein 2 [Cornus florida]|uniref:lysM domain-containing GPI-anchored protein 2 n=1 Tax=Cornus florida TaxID=4283 RepID=UPI00289F82DE|nr:lysM domain-containing GPI-anchored protein 2 [Cornus florida]
MGFAGISLSLTLISLLAVTPPPTTAQNSKPFICTSNHTCSALIDYVLPNSTTLAAVKTLFGVKNFRALLGANNLPPTTPTNQSVPANQTIKIPFPCLCRNGTGISNHRPVYKVVPEDGLDHIARDVFSALVTFQQIQAVNGIPDPDKINVGQELWIPLPCSCDEVEGQSVVHYGHVVVAGSSVDGIAQQFNTTSDILLKLNGLTDPNQLQAGTVIDVPLKACTSVVSSTSLDYPLLVSNGTYVFTATNCVMCKCDSANNWTLQCEPSQVNSSSWPSCPASQCQATESLYLGNTTTTGCNRTTCSYAGYNNQTILTDLAVESTCPVSANSSPKLSLQGWNWRTLIISIQLVLLCLHLL